MKAAYLTEINGPDQLKLGDIPDPCPAPEELLVNVRATAATPTEFGWFPTFHLRSGQPRPFPVVPGHEFSGVVAQVGESVKDFKVGDAVFGLNDWFANGALAEFCLAPARAVASKPRSLDDAQMAVVPISALTAWQGLFDRGKLKAGEHVLIHGGAGAVGVFAVQLARWRGAYVTATASTANVDFVRRLGADQVVDYKLERFEKMAPDCDLVFDAVGGDTLQRSWGLLKPGGRVVTVASNSQEATDSREREAFFIVEPNQSQLSEIARLIEARTLRPFVEAVVPLAQSREAFARAARGGMRGKIAIQVSSSL